ncbi:MAG: hypothetical protein HC869_10330 [Rhodospirillales bacterium]|nr:hypothetical protein [Rhodospirillales bacterium]
MLSKSSQKSPPEIRANCMIRTLPEHVKEICQSAKTSRPHAFAHPIPASSDMIEARETPTVEHLDRRRSRPAKARPLESEPAFLKGWVDLEALLER